MKVKQHLYMWIIRRMKVMYVLQLVVELLDVLAVEEECNITSNALLDIKHQLMNLRINAVMFAPENLKKYKGV